jgi:hypothetical protein
MTLTIMTIIENGTPILMKSQNEYLPGSHTIRLTVVESGDMNAVEAAMATVIANG